jgi:TPR repeat protein
LREEVEKEEMSYKYELAELYQELGTPEDQQEAFNLYSEILAWADTEIQRLEEDKRLREEAKIFKQSLLRTNIYINTKYRLAKLLQNGIKKGEDFLIQKDEEEAVKYYQEIKDVHIDAKYEWANILQSGYQGKERRIPKKIHKAYKLYKQADDQDYMPATYQLASMYENGIKDEVVKDKIKALELYKKAAKGGYIEAQIKLSDLYIQEGPNRNYGKAIKWYLEAAAKGNKIAQYSLAKMFQNGWGLNNTDASLIFQWYKAAAKQGHLEAQYELGRLYKNRQTESDYHKALIWFEKSGTKEANFELGIMYEQGLGLNEPDLAKAKEYYEKAVEQGHKEALFNLVQISLTSQDKGDQLGLSSKLMELMSRTQGH